MLVLLEMVSDSSFLRIYVEIPIDATILAVALLKPLIALGEMVTLELSFVSTLHVEAKSSSGLTNPLDALSGLGCTLFKMRCLSAGMPVILFCAGVPQAKNTTPFVRTLDTVSMTF